MTATNGSDAHPTAPRRWIGTGDDAIGVFPVGLGAMPLSLRAGLARQDAIAVVHAALDAGVTLIDTAFAYAPLDGDNVGHNERLVAEALRTYGGSTADVLVATKGGITREPGGAWVPDGRPDHLLAACDASLLALDVDRIALYQLHRPDPGVPFVESIGALADLRSSGKIGLVGLSNVDVPLIDEALAVLGPDGVASVQNQLSPGHREGGEVLRFCADRGIAFLPWSPLGGMWGRAGRLSDEHHAFAEVAAERGVSPQRLTIAWHLALASVVIPIPGASRPSSIRDSAAAAEIELTAAEMDRLGWV